jgi:hypothetical protein
MRYRLRTLLFVAAIGPPLVAGAWWAADVIAELSPLALQTDPLRAAVWLLWGLLVAAPIVPLSVLAIRAALVRRFERHELLELITALAATLVLSAWTWTQLDFYRE